MSDETTREDGRPAAGQADGLNPTSAVAIPLVALGLLAAAVWLGTKPAAVQPDAGSSPAAVTVAATADPLPSWNDGPAKRAILGFVTAVTTEASPQFVPRPERIAVFDHDGTLVCEKPLLHGMFLVEQIRRLVERRPELTHEEPYATLLTGDLDFVRRLGKKFFTELTFSALAGVAEEKLEADAREFVRTARHPAFGVPLGDVVYQPMKELIALLRSRGFDVWICSGSGVHFMRPAAEIWHGIPPDRVIASRPLTELREVEAPTAANESHPNRRLDLVVLPQLHVLNDEERKPVSIGEHIGRRPILAVGNVGTGGDVEMLRWSQAGDRPSLQLMVLHDDAEREVAYGEPTNESLEAATKYGWQVVRIAEDWRQVFATPLRKSAAIMTTTPPPLPTTLTPENAVAAPDPAAANDQAGRWNDELAAYERADRVSPPESGGVVLIGSSNIRMWNTLAEDFPGINVLNRGVGGCRLAELAEFAPQLIASSKPRVVVVSAGTNDVASGATADEIRSSFERLVAAVRREAPDATLVFLAISPSIKRWEQRERQAAANDVIKEVVAAHDRSGDLVYLDASAAFLGPDGLPAAECFLDDMQHPSTIGNARRAELIRPVLKALLSGTEPGP